MILERKGVEEERKTSRTDQGWSRKSGKRAKQIRVKSYQNSVEIALRSGVTMVDRNEPTDQIERMD